MLNLSQPFLEHNDTVICFGDSLTAAKDGYVTMLQNKLKDYHVINAGRGGDKTPWALTRFQSDILDRKPDALLIFLGANDAAVGRGCWADEPVVSVDAYRCNLIWMCHLAKLQGIRKISICTPAPFFEDEPYLAHGDILSAYCLAAREAADHCVCRLVPFDAAFRIEWKRHPGHTGKLLTRDGTHLTEQGNQLLAETILAAWKLTP
ncbi:MAG: GDSL-type esterase/lipase family protein [Lentisphaeria bacterium]